MVDCSKAIFCSIAIARKAKAQLLLESEFLLDRDCSKSESVCSKARSRLLERRKRLLESDFLLDRDCSKAIEHFFNCCSKASSKSESVCSKAIICSIAIRKAKAIDCSKKAKAIEHFFARKRLLESDFLLDRDLLEKRKSNALLESSKKNCRRMVFSVKVPQQPTLFPFYDVPPRLKQFLFVV
jgi:hypothetical protein